MKLAKIEMSEEIIESLNNKDLPILNMYLSWLKRDGEYFISGVRGDGELNFDLIIQDYSCNEPESTKFWDIVNKSKKEIRTIINIVNI